MKTVTVLIMTDSEMQNVVLMREIADVVGEDVPVNCYILYEHVGLKDRIRNICSNDKNNLCDFYLFKEEGVCCRHMFLQHPIYEKYEGNTEAYDFHGVITGFNEFGHQVCLYMMTQAVFTPDNRIVIDVLDNKLDENLDTFLLRFSTDYLIESNNKGYWDREFIINGNNADGELIIRFTKTGYEGRQYNYLLDEIVKDSGSTLGYSVINIEDEDIAVSAVEMFIDNLKKNNIDLDFPIGVRSNNVDVIKFLKKTKVFEVEDILNVENIVSTEEVYKASQYHYYYSVVSDWISDISRKLEFKAERKEIETIWNELGTYERNSSMLMSRFDTTRAFIMKNILKPNSYNDIERVINGFTNEKGLYATSEKDYPVIVHGVIEHRRWCYAMSILGWRAPLNNEEQIKCKKKRINPCMCNWKTLSENMPECTLYDLVPLCYLMKK